MSRLPTSYFDQLYAADPDPWRFETRWYEKRKYALTMASLPRHRYRRALEPGCSIGVLTELLAHRCDEVIATDIVEDALQQTRERILRSDASGVVDCRSWAFGDPWEHGRFDLIVLSEIGYYLDRDSLAHALDTAVAHLEDGGTLLLVHWQHDVDEYPLSGAEVHAIARATKGLGVLGSYTDLDMALDVYTAGTTSTSVATWEGLDTSTRMVADLESLDSV